MERTTRAEIAMGEELGEFFVDTAAQTRLDELLRAELDVSIPLHTLSSRKPELVTEGRSEKAHKLRLLSGSTPAEISYVRGELGPSMFVQLDLDLGNEFIYLPSSPRARSIEDDDAGATRRHQRAVECAVDTGVLIRHAPTSNLQVRPSYHLSIARAQFRKCIFGFRHTLPPRSRHPPKIPMLRAVLLIPQSP